MSKYKTLTITIDNCRKCPYSFEDSGEMGCYKKSDVEGSRDKIPDNCPLPDKE